MAQVDTPRRVRNTLGVIGALVLIGIIIWIDLATGLWNDLVIIAGLAAGLVSFLLTVLVLNRITARATERKWAPVTRLALTEFLHALADEKHSEISRGHIVPRSLPLVEPNLEAEHLHTALHDLRHEVVAERRHLTRMLGSWAEFLASSGANEEILRHVAVLSLQLDRVRDVSLEVEHSPTATGHAQLASKTQKYNELLLSLEAEIRDRIAYEDRLAR